MKRRFNPGEPEWMDRPQPVSPELERDLANIRLMNRRFGSHRQLRFFLRRWLKTGSHLRILDVATGSGDIPRLIVDFAKRRGASVTIEAIDQQAATVEIARRLSASYPEVTFEAANLFNWNPGEPYDFVFCSLALHHFGDEDAVRALAKLRALSRGGVLVADLRRARWLTLAIFLMSMFFREAMTKNDARVSAVRAFNFREMRRLAKKAGWQDFQQRRFAIGRQAIWIDP